MFCRQEPSFPFWVGSIEVPLGCAVEFTLATNDDKKKFCLTYQGDQTVSSLVSQQVLKESTHSVSGGIKVSNIVPVQC